MSNRTYDLPSEYFIDSIEIKSLFSGKKHELLYLYDQIIINEGINFPFMYGIIFITDLNGIIENLPIIGEERISFKLRKKQSDKKYFEIKGFVYKISNRRSDPTGKKIEYFEIHFITETAINNQTKRVSKTYDGLVSEMIQKITKDFFDLNKIEKIDEENPKPYETILIETTMDKSKINIPNKSPIDAIDFLSENFSYSKSTKSDKNSFNTSFFFFQTRQSFFFQSIENLINERIKTKSHEYYIMNDVSIEGSGVKKDHLFTVIKYRLKNFYDNFESSNTGYYGGTNFAYDSITKTLHEYKLNYSQNFDNMIHLDKNDTNTKDFIYNKEPEKTFFLSLNTRKGCVDESSKYIKKYTSNDIFHLKEEQIDLLKNTKQERFNNGLVVEIEIPSNINLHVCDIIDLKFPSYERENNQKRYMDDKYLSGNYIVLSIQHVLSNIDIKKWTMNVTLLKDSYKSELK